MQEAGLARDPGLLQGPGAVLELGLVLGPELEPEPGPGLLLGRLPVLGSGLVWLLGLVQRREEGSTKEIEERGGMLPSHDASGPRRRRTT